MTNVYEYYVDKDERGEFAAHVREIDTERVIWETQTREVFEDGYMNHAHDLVGLHDYLVELGLMNNDDELYRGN